MSLGHLSVWISGILNGYNKDGIPNSYKYVPISVVSGVHIIRALGEQTNIPARPAGLLAGLFIGIPAVTAAMFCTGTFVGKSVQHVFSTNKSLQ